MAQQARDRVHRRCEPTPAIVLGANNATVRTWRRCTRPSPTTASACPPVLVTKITGPDGAVVYQHAHTPDQGHVLGERPPDRPCARGSDPARHRHAARPSTDLRAARPDRHRTTPTRGSAGTPSSSPPRCGWGSRSHGPTRAGQRQLVSMTPPNTRITVYGGTYPAQIWASFMKQRARRRRADAADGPAHHADDHHDAAGAEPRVRRTRWRPPSRSRCPTCRGLDAATADGTGRAGRAPGRAGRRRPRPRAQPGSVLNQSPTARQRGARGAARCGSRSPRCRPPRRRPPPRPRPRPCPAVAARPTTGRRLSPRARRGGRLSGHGLADHSPGPQRARRRPGRTRRAPASRWSRRSSPSRSLLGGWVYVLFFYDPGLMIDELADHTLPDRRPSRSVLRRTTRAGPALPPRTWPPAPSDRADEVASVQRHPGAR